MTHSEMIPGFPAGGGCQPGESPRPAHCGPMAAVSARLLVIVIQLYRWTISPALVFLVGPDNGCRFTPTCSQYAIEAIREHGAAEGSLLALRRICRCHPFAECGHDPVPRRGSQGDSG